MGWIIAVALYNFYAISVVGETGLHKAYTKFVSFFAVTKVQKITLYLPVYVASQLCGLAFLHFVNVHPDTAAFSACCERRLLGSHLDKSVLLLPGTGHSGEENEGMGRPAMPR